MSMLKIYDQNMDFAGRLTSGVDYKDLRITSQTASGDQTLECTIMHGAQPAVDCEYYIETETQRYVVKSASVTSRGETAITAQLDLEDLQATTWQTFTVTDTTARAAAEAALTGTGWTVSDQSEYKLRNVATTNKTASGVLDEIRSAFMIEMTFDTLHKVVTLYTQQGSYKGAYFMSGLNLRKLTRKTSSYDFVTMIEPYGADGLDISSVNAGSKRIENHTWSRKKVCLIYQDTNYSDPQALKDDMTAYLADLSKLRRSYAVDVIDLAKINEKYDILEYELGDQIMLIDRDTATRDKQRIVKLTEYPDEPERNTCEISNTVLTWEQLQARSQKTQELVEATITTDGKVSVQSILAFERGEVTSDGDLMSLTDYVAQTNARLDALEGG